MYKKEKNMKKQMAKIVALIMAIVVITTMAACSGGVVATPENSYTISIYKEIKTQDQYGAVETTDYILWQSLNVIKTQMYDLPGGNNTNMSKPTGYNFDYGDVVYQYVNVSGTKYKTAHGIEVLPSRDETIFVRERQLKNIRFFIDGENIYDKLSEESKESFSKIYYGTYAESFPFNDRSYIGEGLLNYVREFLGRTIYSSDIKLYVGNQREKEIPADGVYINLIQSTDVNIVIN